MNSIQQLWVSSLEDLGVGCRLRQYHGGWPEIVTHVVQLPVEYLEATTRYQLAYLSGSVDSPDSIVDLSCILVVDGRQIGMWVVTYTESSDQKSMTSYGRPILSPLFVDGLPEKFRIAISKKCLEALCQVATECGIGKLEFQGEPSVECRGADYWQRFLLERGGETTLNYRYILDLQLGYENASKHYRKSYRQLIKKGKQYWKIGCYQSNCDPALWESVRELHFTVAGRRTRSSDTWAIQYEALLGHDALLVTAHSSEDELVGAGYFGLTNYQATYDVGVYDRRLFDKPIGHVIQDAAIQNFSEKGISEYIVGQALFTADLASGVSEKELSISRFKAGFADQLRYRYLIRLNIWSDR